MKTAIYFSLLVLFFASGCQKTEPITTTNPSENQTLIPETTSSPPALALSMLTMPIANALERITKKPFGIYITSQNSPVFPEKFKGYHTGTDFEVLEDELNIDIPIFTACDGKLILKKSVTGYGGVAVQSCRLDEQNVTIIYGHLKLSSIIPEVGDQIIAGQKLGILGEAYTAETDGERKHLHFAIHKGADIVLLGYTQDKNSLSDWLNAENYLK